MRRSTQRNNPRKSFLIMISPLKIPIPAMLFTALIIVANSCQSKSGKVKITTAEVTEITQTGALSGGNIDARKEKSILARGVCWSTLPNPTLWNSRTSDGAGTGAFVSLLKELKPVTLYYLRSYMVSVSDTSYGQVISFTTQDYGSVTDIEGNDYNTITIGTQTWMAKNLGTTKYNDGAEIPLVEDKSAWASLATPAYCWYKNDKATYKEFYGALYNSYAAGTEKLCPAGWHVPTDADWNILTNFLGGEAIAGGKMKEAGTSRWVRPNNGGTNSAYFNGLPGGLRYSDGEYHDFGFSGYWWSSTQFLTSRAFFRFLYHQDSCIYRFDNQKNNGFSVRCIKDK